MSLTDPVAITLGGTAYNLPRVSTGQNKSEYFLDTEAADGKLRFTASNAYGRRTRRVARLDQNKLIDSVLVSGTSFDAGASAYLVIDEPQTGFTIADREDLAKALVDYLSGTSYAALVKILGGQS